MNKIHWIILLLFPTFSFAQKSKVLDTYRDKIDKTRNIFTAFYSKTLSKYFPDQHIQDWQVGVSLGGVL